MAWEAHAKYLVHKLITWCAKHHVSLISLSAEEYLLAGLFCVWCSQINQRSTQGSAQSKQHVGGTLAMAEVSKGWCCSTCIDLFSAVCLTTEEGKVPSSREKVPSETFQVDQYSGGIFPLPSFKTGWFSLTSQVVPSHPSSWPVFCPLHFASYIGKWGHGVGTVSASVSLHPG